MKIIEMLRLSELGLSQRQIATSAGCAKSTVGDVLKLCKGKGVGFEKASKMTASELHSLLYPEQAPTRKRLPEPDWKEVHEELLKHKNLNLQFMWEEYKVQHPDGLSYSRYCIHYRQYREAAGRGVHLHNERKAGEVVEVDWMGDTLPCVVDGESGEIADAHFFVAIMGYSGYPYVEAFPNEQEPSWIVANVNALHYFGGVPRIIEPDNCQVAIKKPRYYEPVINSAYWELAQHYAVAIVPARVKKWQDKPLVEQSVGWLETWLLGQLRNQIFFSFYELNEEIRKIIYKLSRRPFKDKKRNSTRWGDFQRIDQPALRPLPAQRYEIADIVFRTVGDNYHVEYACVNYSVPYTLHKERVAVRATGTTVEIFDKNHIRMATHRRQNATNRTRYVSDIAHMPPNHKAVYQARQFDADFLVQPESVQ